MSTSRRPRSKQGKSPSRTTVRTAKTFSRDVPLYPAANRKFPGPETADIEASDEMPPTPREMEFYNVTSRPRTSNQRSKRTTTGKKSVGRRPRKPDIIQTSRNASTQTLPSLSKVELSNNALEDITFEELKEVLRMIRKRSSHEHRVSSLNKTNNHARVSAPNKKMFDSGLESHLRHTRSSPSRVHFLQKSHEGKLNVVPRLKIEKLISPRVQMYDNSPRATLSSERSQSSEHACIFGHAIPSPRSAFSDIGSSRSDGVNTPR